MRSLSVEFTLKLGNIIISLQNDSWETLAMFWGYTKYSSMRSLSLTERQMDRQTADRQTDSQQKETL